MDHEASFNEQVLHTDAADVEHVKHEHHEQDIPNHDHGHDHDHQHIHPEHHVHHEHEENIAHDRDVEHEQHHVNHNDEALQPEQDNDPNAQEAVDNSEHSHEVQPTPAEDAYGQVEHVHAQTEQTVEHEDPYHQHPDEYEHDHSKEVQDSEHAHTGQYHCPKHRPGARHSQFDHTEHDHVEPEQGDDDDAQIGDDDAVAYEELHHHHHHHDHEHVSEDPERPSQKSEDKAVDFTDASGSDKGLGANVDDTEQTDARDRICDDGANARDNQPAVNSENAHEKVEDEAEPAVDVEHACISVQARPGAIPEQPESYRAHGDNEAPDEQLHRTNIGRYGDSLDLGLDTSATEVVGDLTPDDEEEKAANGLTLAMDGSATHEGEGEFEGRFVAKRDATGGMSEECCHRESCDVRVNDADVDSMNNVGNDGGEVLKRAGERENSDETCAVGVSSGSEEEEEGSQGRKREHVEMDSGESEEWNDRKDEGRRVEFSSNKKLRSEGSLKDGEGG